MPPLAGRKPQRIEPTISMPGSAPAKDEPADAPVRLSSVAPPRLVLDPADRPFVEEMRRPVGLTLLAVFLVLGGLGLFIIEILAIERVLNAVNAVGGSALSAAVQVLALSILYVIAGIQVWEGRKWGWILAMAALLHGIATSLQGLALAAVLDTATLQGGATLSAYLKFGLRALLHGGVMVYMFRASVLEFFAIPRESSFKYLGLIAVVVLVIYVFLSVSA